MGYVSASIMLSDHFLCEGKEKQKAVWPHETVLFIFI